MSICLLIARQRSGTSALAHYLDGHPEIVYRGEILDAASPDSFFSWMANKNLATSTVYDYAPHFAAYLQDLKGQDKTNIIDIKYNSICAIEPPFYSFALSPWILFQARKHALPVIHLRRANLLDCFVSAKLAEKNRIWHVYDPNEMRNMKKSMKVDIDEFMHYFDICLREDRAMEKHLANHPRKIELEYDDTFLPDGRVAGSAAAALGELLDHDLSELDRVPKTFKQAPASLVEKIENIEEVLTAFAKYRLSF